MVKKGEVNNEKFIHNDWLSVDFYHDNGECSWVVMLHDRIVKSCKELEEYGEKG